MKAMRLASLCLMVIFASTSSAWAVLVTFQWQTTSFNSTLPGVSNGDVITLDVLADNGGSSLASQTWNNADIQSGVLTVGSYQATYSPPTGFGNPVFQTDVNGVVSNARLVFTASTAHFDTLGGTNLVSLARNLALTSVPNQVLNWGSPSPTPGDTFSAPQWTVGLTSGSGPMPLPEPATIILFGIGLAGLGYAMRRRHKGLGLQTA